MNDQDKELLERYLKDVRKRNKKIAFFMIFVFFITSIIFYGGYDTDKKTMNDIDNSTQMEIENNIININNTNDKVNESNTNVISNQNTKEEKQEDELSKENVVTKEETTS